MLRETMQYYRDACLGRSHEDYIAPDAIGTPTGARQRASQHVPEDECTNLMWADLVAQAMTHSMVAGATIPCLEALGLSRVTVASMSVEIRRPGASRSRAFPKCCARLIGVLFSLLHISRTALEKGGTHVEQRHHIPTVENV
jgi:hypothetical protein